MSKYRVQPTGRESPMGEEELIVSKTDPKGRITYANHVFVRVSQFSLEELIGTPHSIVRHPDMPRCVFKLLWDTIEAKQEIFAYVLNMTKHGDYYWVLAHVTPSFDSAGNIIAYHSSRRKPDADQIAKIKPIYDSLLAEEAKFEDRKAGMESAFATMVGMLSDMKMSYEEFVFTI